MTRRGWSNVCAVYKPRPSEGLLPSTECLAVVFEFCGSYLARRSRQPSVTTYLASRYFFFYTAHRVNRKAWRRESEDCTRCTHLLRLIVSIVSTRNLSCKGFAYTALNAERSPRFRGTSRVALHDDGNHRSLEYTSSFFIHYLKNPT